MPGDLEDELDRLYGLDLAEFVGERANLAGALRREGRRAEATRVQELRKPPLSVWTINQLARRRREHVNELLETGERLVEAQRALLNGGGRESFAQARERERELLNLLVEEARSLLSAKASAATLERLTATLRAAAVSDATRADLARGRLTEDVDPAGFEGLAGAVGVVVATPPNRTSRPREPSARRMEAARLAAAKRERVERARAELSAANEQKAILAKRLGEAERAKRDAHEQYRNAEEARDRLRGEHEEAVRAVEIARGRLSRAREPSQK